MGEYTSNNYFYKPSLGASGETEKGNFDAALDGADEAIAQNANNITPQAYASTMTGDETFTDPGTAIKVFFLTPNGINRNFDPNGSFNSGIMVIVKNCGNSNNIVFDSVGIAVTILPGYTGYFWYDATAGQWRQ